MTFTTTQYFCKRCRRELSKEESICSNCESKFKLVKLVIKDIINVHDNIKLRKHPLNTSPTKYSREVVQGWFPNTKTQDTEYGVDKIRIIDREKNEYHETVRELETDKLIHDVHEPLTEHRKKPKSNL